MTTPSKVRLFVYGTLLSEQRDHGLLESAELLGPAQTEPHYILVDIGVYAALVADGKTAVHGEVYLVDRVNLARIDVLRQVPNLFQRQRITLLDASIAETYLMTLDQVRGKRRLGHGNWRERFAPRTPRDRNLPLAKWARERFSKS